MAGTYSANGSYVYQDDWRAEVYVTVTDLNATTCRVTVRGEWDSIYGNSSYCTGTITKNGSGGTDSGIGLTITTGGHGTIASRTFDVTRGSSTKYITCKAVVVGGGSTYSGVSSTASVNVPIPAIAYQAPEPPTGCAASRVSDSSATVSWTNGATSTTKPRTAVLVERMTDEGAWTQIASAASTATSYSDNSISANHRYAYRVRSQGNGGYSSYSTADGYVFTTPAAPSSVVLSKTAQTTIQVDVEGSAPYATGYAVELTYDGGSTWESVESSTSLPITVTVSGGTVQFRVASLNGTLQSAWTLSETIVTICPPLAPTITSRPSNPTAMGSSCTVEWLPNHPDGTAQQSAQVKITRPSGTSSTIDLTAEKSYTFTPELAGTYSIQVRTKGLDEDWGAWSDSVSWGVYEPPVVVVTSPATDGAEIVALPLNVSWSVTDSTGVSTQRVIIADSSGEVFNRQVGGDVFSLSLTDSDVALQNETAYTITVRSMGGSGLITAVQRTFAVSWLPPVAPTLELSEGEGASTLISIGSDTFDLAGEVLELPRSGIMTSLHIDGKSVQDGTPSPSNPVPIRSVESRNLLQNNASSHTFNGVTFTVHDDGTVSVSGTATANTFVDLGRGSLTLPAGTYTTSGAVGTGCSAYMYSNDPVAVLRNGFGTFELSSETTVFYRFGVANGATADYTLYPQIEYGSTAHDYQPYGCINIVEVVKNLFNPLVYSAYANGDGSYTATAGQLHAAQFYMTEQMVGKELTFSAYIFNNAANNLRVAARVNGTTINGNYNGTADVFSKVTFTPVSTSDYVYFEYSSSGNASIRDVQLEYGSEATEYEPYTDASTYIDLQGNALRSLPDGTRDELDVDGEGNVTLTKRVGSVTLDGTEDWTVISGRNYGTYTGLAGTIQTPPTTTTPTNSYCNLVSPVQAQNASAAPNIYITEGIAVGSTGNVFLNLVGNAGGTTVDALKAALAATPAEFLYPLATPQTISLGRIDLPYCTDTAYVDAMVQPNISASFRYADSADTPETESVTVQRVNPDGTTWTVASNLPLGGTCIDPLPPLGVEATYLATASAQSGATASETYGITIGGREWVLNFGNAAQEFTELLGNPQASYTLEHGGESYHFADGGTGGGLPVFYPTTDRDENGSLSFDDEMNASPDELRELCRRNPVAWLRDPFGHRWRAHVSPSTSHGVGRLWNMGIDWSAVRWREAW